MGSATTCPEDLLPLAVCRHSTATGRESNQGPSGPASPTPPSQCQAAIVGLALEGDMPTGLGIAGPRSGEAAGTDRLLAVPVGGV